MKKPIAPWIVVVFACGICSAEDGSNYEHLKFLDSVVGTWQVELLEGDQIVSRGQEVSEWLLKKNCLKQHGWGQVDGQNVRYRFYTVWNAKTKEVLQLAVGAMDGSYAMVERVGRYRPGESTWTNRDTTIVSDGTRYTSLVTVNLSDTNGYTMDFREQMKNGEAMPSQHSKYVPGDAITPPAYDATPGPGYEKLKFLDFSVGRWKLEGEIPEVGKYVGEELNTWIYDKNFLHTIGHGTMPDGDRVEYELILSWDPAEKAVVTWIFGSDGAHARRKGTYDATARVLTCHQVAIDAKGNESRAVVETKLIDDDSFHLRFTDQLKIDAETVELKATRIRD